MNGSPIASSPVFSPPSILCEWQTSPRAPHADRVSDAGAVGAPDLRAPAGWALVGQRRPRRQHRQHRALNDERISRIDLGAVKVWPGVRRAGLPRLSGGADARPGAAQRRRLMAISSRRR